jgi:hypothetical protein
MAANWWEIGKLVDTKPTTTDEEKNWWEIGRVVEEPKKEPQPSVAPEAQPAQGPVGFGPLSMLMESLPAVKQELTSVFTPETVQGVGSNIPLTAQLAILSSNLETIDNTMVDSPEKQKAQADTLKQIEDIQRQIQANTPEDLGFLQRGVRLGLENLPAMGIGTIASIAARSPAPALATAGALTRTQSYGQARAEGLAPDLAGTYADINAAIEVGLEASPTTKLLDAFNVKDAAGLKKKVLEFALTEGVTEQATTALQTLNDLAFQLDQQLANAESPLEAAKIQAERQALTAVATVVGGGTQAAGVGALNKIQRDRLLKQVESGERDLEDIGVEIEQIQIEKAREDALNSAANIAAPTPDEVRTEPGQTEATPFQSSESYAEKIFNSVGQFIPTDTTFKVETKDIDGTQSIVVTDQNGRQYGQAFQNKDQADQLALSLNNLTKSRDGVLKELEPLGTSLKDVLKGYGLNDIGLKLDTKIFGRRGEAMTSEGLFDPVVRQVFLAVDAIDPTGTLNTDQRREALRGVLRHEVVHALRYLDLWKKKEWKTLEKAAANLKKEGTDKTYLDVAREAYSDQNKVVQVEEAVAEMIRDVADRQAKFAGRPRSLSERAVQFFDRTKNALTGAGFQTYDDVIQRFEQGIVGSRERGQIRTLRAVEERAAEKGQVPERLQRLFTNPEERNKFRQETVQNLQTQKGPVSQPVANSLNTQGLRESRSFVEPVPEKIQVGDRSVGTRDSEGRLIYSGYEGPEVFGIQTRPTQEGLQNFWNWFGTSKTIDKQGRPLVFYHGTAADITAFRPKQAGSVFVTRSPEFAEEFGFLSDNYMVSNFPDFMSDQQVVDVLNETLANPASFSPKYYDQVAAARDQAIADVQAGKAIRPAALKPLKDIAADGRSSRYLNAIQKRLPSSANMIPVYVKADKPWDYDNKDDVKAVVRRARDNGADITASMIEEIGQGNWQTIEGSEGNAPILDAIRELGYDSMYVEEQGEKNLAVFDPGQVKSAIGNNGEFSPTTPSIRESRKQPVYNIVNSRTGEVVGQADTINGARRAVDRRDNQYGASVHTIQTVDAERDAEQRAKSRERLGLPALRESRGINVEVAPDPRDQEATNTFNSFPEETRAQITTEVADPVVRNVMRNLGIQDYQVEYTLGGFQGGTQPSIIVRFGNDVPYERIIESSKILGTLWKQQAVITYDENDKEGGDQRQYVKVTPSRPLSYSETQNLFNRIYQAYPNAAGFTSREGSLVFGNFDNTPPEEFLNNLRSVVGDNIADLDYDAETSSSIFRSDWIEPVNLEGTQYGQVTGTPGVAAGRDNVRRQREFDSLQSQSDELFRRAVELRSQRARDRAGRDQVGAIAPLEGAPIIEGATGPDPEIVSVAEGYARKLGIPYSRQRSYVEVDPDRAKRIADAYEAMAHAPQDPAVKQAYDDLIRQTRDQYDALTDAGYSFTFFDSNTDPYQGNPWNAMRDLRANKRMAVYGTYDGFGTEGITDAAVEDNPLLRDTGLRWPDQNGVLRPVTANDLFRAVHDAFGHGLEGAGFRARGEENAWQAHAQLFTGPALGALTSETRGQNSWLNYGPYGEKNRTANVLDTVFAEQKSGLMPSWTWQEGLETPVVPAAREAKRKKPKEGVPLGPPNPGPETDFDTTAAAEALNNSQPVDQMGIPAGPLVTDTMPDNTVDISRARLDPLMKRLITGVEFFQSAPDKLRSGVGLTDIAKRIEDYYDTYAERLGIVNSIIRDANKNIRIGGNKSALETFERFIRARENNRADEAAAIKAEASDSDRQLIDAWEKIAEETGRVNLSVRTPNGQPMKVYDPNLVTGTYGEKVGGFRPIKAVKQFFPRTMRREVLEVMMNPNTDPALYNELLDALVASGKAEDHESADAFLVREYFSDEVKQDYFAGVEKARTDPLPEIFYDYSWDAATRYLRKWARRTSQIQYFGQEMGEFHKDWFDTNIKKIRDDETQKYLNEIKNRIYEIESFGPLTNIMSWLNSIATGTMLGNPIGASLNLFGGTTSNVQAFGILQVGKSYLELLTDWKQVQKEGTTLGILNTDFLNILSDHVENDAGKYFSKTEKVSEALSKFTNVMLTYGGFNGAENVVRATAMLAARSWLNDSLKAVNENPNSKKAKKFYEWVRRENLDADKLILENGAGEETGKFLRRAVNVPQGSYKIDMTPVFVDTAAGRFFLKYQKFGTQINRFFYRHFLKPFFDNPSPATFFRVIGFLGSAIVGGQVILAIREAFGYGDPGPDDEEIKKAFENEDTSRGWALLFSRVWQNIMAAGSAGNFGNYLQFSLDWQDQLRPKNPLSPPGIASIDNFVEFVNKILNQKGITARDIDETLETSLSFYRAYKRIGLGALDSIGADFKEVKRFASRKEMREIREISRRYSDEMELEYKRRVAPGAVVRTPMSPVNRAVVDALYAGDGARARAIIREAQKGLPRKERERVLRSVQAAARNGQPIQIAGVSPSKEIRRDFDRWARQNLPAEKVQLIKRVDRNYRRAARTAGISIGD